MRITQRAYAKINWSLRILGARPDGYHELDMLMQSLELHDELILENSRWLGLSISGQKLPVGEKNLVMRAANALNAFTGQRNGARIHLVKNIPMRAGLGGGSADCAATLLALNRLWNLRIPMQRLMQIGASLGGDVPFCMQGGMARVQGKGERISAMPDMPSVPMVLVRVGRGLSTPQVFAQYDRAPRQDAVLSIPDLASALHSGNLERAWAQSGNALEAPAMELMPEIGAAMENLRRLGASFVRMTGSGSTVFGAFSSETAAQMAADAIPDAILTRTRPETDEIFRGN